MNTTPKPGAIHLHIDNLVLRGFTRIDEAAFAAALQEALRDELRQELCKTPALQDGNLSDIRASVTLPANYNAHSLGSVLARSLTRIACADLTATPLTTTRESRHG